VNVRLLPLKLAFAPPSMGGDDSLAAAVLSALDAPVVNPPTAGAVRCALPLPYA